MNYKEKLEEATKRLNRKANDLYDEEAMTVQTIKEILTPCGEHGCLIGSEDYADDIYYVYAEPKPNQFFRVLQIRYLPLNDALEVLLGFEERGCKDFMDIYDTDEGGWMAFGRARVNDLRFLIDEIVFNLEYSDGYQEDEFEFLIDEDGKKYNPATSILSGGMDIRCDYNEEALFAYKTRKTIEEITAYLMSKGWVKRHKNTYHEFRKGNTVCFFNDWQGPYGFTCFGTEYEPDNNIKALAELKAKIDASMEQPKAKRYAVPFLRTQWADVYVDAANKEEAIEKAERIFNEGHDGDIEWEDIDCPEYDNIRGVEER